MHRTRSSTARYSQRVLVITNTLSPCAHARLFRDTSLLIIHVCPRSRLILRNAPRRAHPMVSSLSDVVTCGWLTPSVSTLHSSLTSSLHTYPISVIRAAQFDPRSSILDAVRDTQLRSWAGQFIQVPLRRTLTVASSILFHHSYIPDAGPLRYTL